MGLIRFLGVRTYSVELRRDLELLEKNFNDLVQRTGPLFANEPAASFTQTTNNTPVSPAPANHAWRHATSGSTEPDVGADPITPYQFTWTGFHTFKPSLVGTPVTIIGTNTVDQQVGDLLVTKDNFYQLNFLDTHSSVAADHCSNFIFRRTRGTAGAPTVVATSDQIGLVAWRARDTAGNYIQTAVIGALVNGAVGAASVPTDILFQVGATQQNFGTSEKMRLTSLGRLGIGTPGSSGTVDTLLHIVGGGPQVKVEAAANNFFTLSVAANGVATFDNAGSAPSYVFRDPLRINTQGSQSPVTPQLFITADSSTAEMAVSVAAITGITTFDVTAGTTPEFKFADLLTANTGLRIGPNAGGFYSRFNVVVGQGADITYSLPPTTVASSILSNDGASPSVLTWATPATLGLISGTGVAQHAPIWLTASTQGSSDLLIGYAGPFTSELSPAQQVANRIYYFPEIGTDAILVGAFTPATDSYLTIFRNGGQGIQDSSFYDSAGTLTGVTNVGQGFELNNTGGAHITLTADLGYYWKVNRPNNGFSSFTLSTTYDAGGSGSFHEFLQDIALDSGVIRSYNPDVASLSTIAFSLTDKVVRTVNSTLWKISSDAAGLLNYASQNMRGETTFGYSGSPQSGYVLGFQAQTGTRFDASLVNHGGLFFIQHNDTGITPTRVAGIVAVAYGASGATTTPSNAAAYTGIQALAGQALDTAGFGGKIAACYYGNFTKTGAPFSGQASLDSQLSTNCPNGNLDHVAIFWGNLSAYNSSIGNPTNKPVIASTMRAVIQGLGTSVQCAIYGDAVAFTTPTRNVVTDSYFMRVPFPLNTSATNRAHLQFVTTAAAAGGPTYATSGGLYFDTGTNNPIGLAQYNGTNWQWFLTPTMNASGAIAAGNAGTISGLWGFTHLQDVTFDASKNINMGSGGSILGNPDVTATGATAATAGIISLTAGSGTTTNAGAAATITSGDGGPTSGSAGHINMNCGSAPGASGSGGSLNIRLGAGPSSNGSVAVTNSASKTMILNFNSVTAAHSLVIPDVTGTLACYDVAQTWGATQTLNHVVFTDAKNITFNTGTGTKIGTATGEKFALWNKTPIIQPAAAGQAAAAAQGQQTLTDSTTGTPGTTLAAAVGAVYATDFPTIINWIASLAAQLALIKTDVANIKTLQDATRTAMVDFGSMKGAA